MPRDLNDAANDFRGISVHFDKNSDRLVRLSARLSTQAIITATPVDTGRARSNWQVSIGTPNLDTVETYGKRSSIIAPLSKARGILRQASRIPNASIYLTNNLPYIKRLNEGWSAQAPAGFVETAMAEVRARMEVITNQFTTRAARAGKSTVETPTSPGGGPIVRKIPPGQSGRD